MFILIFFHLLQIQLVTVLGLFVLFTIIAKTESQGAPEITPITIEKLLASIPGLKESLDKERLEAKKSAKKIVEKAPAAPVTTPAKKKKAPTEAAPPQEKSAPRKIPRVPARNARRLSSPKREKTVAPESPKEIVVDTPAPNTRRNGRIGAPRPRGRGRARGRTAETKSETVAEPTTGEVKNGRVFPTALP